jgi:hypothetical protein
LISEAATAIGWQRALRFAMPVTPSQSVWRLHNWHPVSQSEPVLQIWMRHRMKKYKYRCGSSGTVH